MVCLTNIPPSLTDVVCLSAWQRVNLIDGVTKTIPELNIVDYVEVPGENDPEGPKKRCRVVEIYHNDPQPILTLKFRTSNGEEFAVSSMPGHRYYVRNIGWQHASDIKPGDECRTAADDRAVLLSSELDPNPVPVYNFQVEGAHTYFVGENVKHSVLTHNQDCDVDKDILGLPDLSTSKDPVRDFGKIAREYSKLDKLYFQFLEETARKYRAKSIFDPVRIENPDGTVEYDFRTTRSRKFLGRSNGDDYDAAWRAYRAMGGPKPSQNPRVNPGERGHARQQMEDERKQLENPINPDYKYGFGVSGSTKKQEVILSLPFPTDHDGYKKMLEEQKEKMRKLPKLLKLK